MARAHARILVTIWDDPDFQELSVAAQRLYLLLLSQDSLNNAGRILLTAKRWADGCRATTPADIRRSLAELDTARFVVVDEDKEEVLIRSFIRNDGIVKQPQMMKNALREALGVRSPRLRAVLAAELRKLRREDAAFTAEQIDPGFEPDPDPGNGSPIQSQLSLDAASGEPASSPADDCSNADELRRGRGRGRGSVSVRTTSVESAAKRGTRIPEDFTVSQEMVVWAQRECPDVNGKFETAQFVDYWMAKPGANAVKLDWTRTWYTWMRRQQRDAVERGPRLRSVPRPALFVTGTTLEQLHETANGRAAAELIGRPYLPKAQPPSDRTPAAEWDRREAQRFLAEHETEIREALAEREAG